MTTSTDLMQLDDTAVKGTGGVVLPTTPKSTPISQSAVQVSAILSSQTARELRRDYVRAGGRVDSVVESTARHEWNVRTRTRAKRDPIEDLRSLAEMGFAWRDLARMLGVTVPAVQKWRRGESISAENKDKIHRLAAACDCLAYPFEVRDIARWFEVPLLDSVPITPMDLWIAGKYDLVFAAADENVSSKQILDKFDPDWQEHYRSDFETFEASDGQISIRMKER